jgi:hypothetical protein
MPPSIQRRPPMVTGGHTPGTAQLAATASISPTPCPAPNARNSPDPVSTAVISSRRAGHSSPGTRLAITARRPASGMVRAVVASRPIWARACTGSRCRSTAQAYRAMCWGRSRAAPPGRPPGAS